MNDYLIRHFCLPNHHLAANNIDFYRSLDLTLGLIHVVLIVLKERPFPPIFSDSSMSTQLSKRNPISRLASRQD